MLIGFVDYIGWKTRYIATETDIDPDLIQTWSDNLARKLMSGCCGDNELHRFTEGGVYQSSQDGGETWFDDPQGDPRSQTIYYPPLAGDDGDEKRCEGASNAFEFFKQNLIDDLASGFAYAEIFSTAVGVVAILGVTGIGIVIAMLSAAVFVAGVVVVQAAFTSEVWTDFKCILYCNIGDDASYTVEQWTAVKNEVNSTFTGVVQIILWNWINALGYIGLTNSARSNMALGADCSDCDCECDGETIGLGMVLSYGTLVNQTGCNVQSTSIVDGVLYSTTWIWNGTDPFKLTVEGLLSGDTGTSAWQWYLGNGSGPFFGSAAPIGETLSFLELSGNSGAFTVSWDVVTP